MDFSSQGDLPSTSPMAITPLTLDDFPDQGDLPGVPPLMANTLLTRDNFPSTESTSNMTPPMDCFVSGLKMEERVTQSPQVLDHQEKTTPTKKRPRRVTKQPMINNSEDTSDDNRGNRKRVRAEQKKRKRKRRRRNITDEAEVPVREMDDEFKNVITSNGGSLESLKLVIQKKLFATDVNPLEARLLIPRQKIINRFLEQEEDEYLEGRNGGRMNQKRVMLIEPSHEVSQINLRKWFMKKTIERESWSYVLVTGWNQVVKGNGLEEDSVVQLWAFRKGTDLCFALVKL